MSQKESDPIPAAHTYMQAVRALLDEVAISQEEAINQAAAAVIRAAKAGGMIYLFGTGHSHMLAEEGHYRAGGFAPVTPILVSSLMIHESATASSRYERLPGLAPIILSRYQPGNRDVMFIFSNSGVNAVPVEMAMTAREAGTTVIGILSREYCAQAPLSPLGKRLYEVVDIVIDNRTPPGDAIVAIGQSKLHSGPTSTIVGAFLLNAVLTEAISRLEAEGEAPLVYISSNIPGAAEHNANLLKQFKPRNPHL